MISLRSALVRMTRRMLASAWMLASCTPLSRGTSTTGGKGRSRKAAGTASAAALEQDLARRSQRIDSEQGIPMFLVCEDLTGGGGSLGAGPDGPGEKRALAEAFQDTAEAFLQLQPDATEEDVPKVMEILAARDFGETDSRPMP